MAAKQLTNEQHLSGSSIPSIENQAGRSYRDQGHGSQARPLGVPHTPLRDEVRGPRRKLLRGPTSTHTNQTAQVESCQARISTRRPTCCSLKHGSFWGVIRHRQVNIDNKVMTIKQSKASRFMAVVVTFQFFVRWENHNECEWNHRKERNRTQTV